MLGNGPDATPLSMQLFDNVRACDTLDTALDLGQCGFACAADLQQLQEDERLAASMQDLDVSGPTLWDVSTLPLTADAMASIALPGTTDADDFWSAASLSPDDTSAPSSSSSSSSSSTSLCQLDEWFRGQPLLPLDMDGLLIEAIQGAGGGGGVEGAARNGGGSSSSSSSIHGASSAAARPAHLLEQHPLFEALMDLIATAHAAIRDPGADIDGCFARLAGAVTAAAASGAARLRPDRRATLHRDPAVDGFVFTSLGIYRALLLELQLLNRLVPPPEGSAFPPPPPPPPLLLPATRKRCRDDQEADDAEDGQPRKRASTLPAGAVALLKEWLFANVARPYPDDDNKDALAAATGLSVTQINNWFINARRRILKPVHHQHHHQDHHDQDQQ